MDELSDEEEKGLGCSRARRLNSSCAKLPTLRNNLQVNLVLCTSWRSVRGFKEFGWEADIPERCICGIGSRSKMAM